MRYGQPSVASVLDAMRAEGATRVLVLPMYPQYAGGHHGQRDRRGGRLGAPGAPRARAAPSSAQYHDDPGYIGALAGACCANTGPNTAAERLVLSFHGVPHRSLMLGDPYHCQCHVTARLLGEQLGLPKERLLVTFQSRFGKAKWLEPYTEPTLRELATQGVKRVDVMCPGFVADCLETLEEIAWKP
jgi:ferrochelatase